jgi:hypothetical protein
MLYALRYEKNGKTIDEFMEMLHRADVPDELREVRVQRSGPGCIVLMAVVVAGAASLATIRQCWCA